MLQTLLIIFAVLLLIGMLPTWPYSAHWGYFPSGGLLVVLVLAVILLSNGRGRVLP